MFDSLNTLVFYVMLTCIAITAAAAVVPIGYKFDLRRGKDRRRDDRRGGRREDDIKVL